MIKNRAVWRRRDRGGLVMTKRDFSYKTSEGVVMSEYKYAFNKDDLYTGECDSIDEALAEAR